MLSVVLLWMMASTPPSFPIETIVVEGARYTGRDILLASARLREGQTYTEQELRQAIGHIKHLAFVRDAQFSLRRGSARGLYALVIRIEENSLFFFEGAFEWSGYPSLGDFNRSDSYSAGLRTFLGRGGMLYGFVVPLNDLNRYHLGFSHFNLFGQGIYLDLESVFQEPAVEVDAMRRTRNALEHFLDTTLGLPIGRNEWLRLSHTYREDVGIFRLTPRPGLRFDIDQNNRSHLWELSWERDTTDDPVFPETGSLFRRTLYFRDQETRDQRRDPFGASTRETSTEAAGLELDVEYWMNPRWRHVLGFGAHLSASTVQADRERDWDRQEIRGRLRFAYRIELFRHRSVGAFTTGFDAELSAFRLRSQTEGQAMENTRSHAVSLEPHLAWRSRWGLVRASLSIAWRDTTSWSGAAP